MIVDFAQTYLSKDDFKVLKKCLKVDETAEDFKDNVLVKAGGLKALTACFLKHNKKVMAKLGKKRSKNESSSSSDDDSEDEKPKKRKRAMSNVSTRSTTKSE